jgi:hypothetical protein
MLALALPARAYITTSPGGGGGGGTITTNGLLQANLQSSFHSGSNTYNGNFSGTLSNSTSVTDFNFLTHNLLYIGDAGFTNTSSRGEVHFTTGATATGGYVILQATGKTNAIDSNVEIAAGKFAGAFIGDGNAISNILQGPTVSAGANIGVTRTQNPNGSTNTAVAVSDPISLGQANIGTSWLTNVVTPTNSFTGTALDFSKAEETTNLTGNITYTGIANATSGAYNSKIVHVGASGADRTVTVPASWGITPCATVSSFTFTVTNGTKGDFLFCCQLGFSTNVAERVISQ